MVEKARTLPPTLTLPNYGAHAWFVFVTIMLLLFTRIVLPLEIVGAPEDDYLIQTRDTGGLGNFYKLCYALTLVVMAVRIPMVAGALFRQPLLFFFLVYVTASVPFANPVSESFPKAVEYGFASLLGIYLAQQLSYQQYMRLLGGIFVAMALISLFYILFVPHGVVTDPSGVTSMRGAFQNKNTLGIYAAPIVLFFGLKSMDVAGRAAWHCRLLAALSAWFVLGSGAGSSQIALLASIGILVVLMILKRHPVRGLITVALGTVAFFAILAVIVWFYDDVLTLFGTDRTWTGRLTTFAVIFEVIGGNLFFGTHGTNVAIEFIQGVERGNAHSGHLNILLFYGIIGGVLFFSLLAQMGYAAISLVKNNALSFWSLGFLLFVIVTNIAEASTEGVVFWAMLVAHLVGAKTWETQKALAYE